MHFRTYIIFGMERKSYAMKKTAKFLSIIMAAVMLFGLTAGLATNEVYAATRGSDWMANVPADARIANLNIPGSHDSGMCYVQFFTEKFGAQTQYSTIKEQMEMGVRIFDIRLRYDGDGDLALCHGEGLFCCDAYETGWLALGPTLTFETVLKWAKEFMASHKGETIIFNVQHEYEAPDDDDELTYDKALDNWLKKYDDIILKVQKKELKNITMGEARGKVIIPYLSAVGDCGFGNLTDADMNEWNQTASQKWATIKPWLDNAKPQDLTGASDFRAAYTSCTGMNNTILPESLDIARAIKNYILDYGFKCGLHYGWISMDTVDEDLARTIYDSNKYSEQFYISDIRAFCGDSKNAGDSGDWKEIKSEARVQGYTLVDTQFMNCNPAGYNIALGYKLTNNPYEAITDVVGVYGFYHDAPEGYECVMLDNALCNYLSDGSGNDTEDTYLYYTRDDSMAPITELELVEGEGNVIVYGTKDAFDFDKGVKNGKAIGLNIIRDESFNRLGTALSFGTLNIIFGLVIAVLVCIIIVLAVKLKKYKG